jgi:hypothetical protein
MVRLAEATASRELLFRELVAGLQQESRAKRSVIAEYDQAKRLTPFITHGYTATESGELVRKFDEALRKGDEKNVARSKATAVLPIKSPSALPAFLLISPAATAVLNDGGALQPLLRVVEAFHQIELVAMCAQRRACREKQRKARPHADHLGEDSEIPRPSARERRESAEQQADQEQLQIVAAEIAYQTGELRWIQRGGCVARHRHDRRRCGEDTRHDNQQPPP